MSFKFESNISNAFCNYCVYTFYDKNNLGGKKISQNFRSLNLGKNWNHIASKEASNYKFEWFSFYNMDRNENSKNDQNHHLSELWLMALES